MVHSYTSKTPGRITHLLATIEQNTGAVIKNKPKWLKKGDFAQIQIRLEEHLCLELHENYKSLGRITVRKGNFTIACGTTVEFLA
jgi:translation elongation factor EF-1alpha